jgi:hypothetical protein
MKHSFDREHLCEYDPDINGSDAARMERLLRLREEIRNGRYDVEDEFEQRVQGMAERLGDPPAAPT